MTGGLRVICTALFSGLILAMQPAMATTFSGRWLAYSRTAKAITGDIEFSASRISFATGKQFSLSYLGVRPGISLAPNVHSAYLFRIHSPRTVRLLNNNSLCGGSRPATYLGVASTKLTPYELQMMGERIPSVGEELHITVITGRGKPGVHVDRLRLCAEYTFVRFQ